MSWILFVNQLCVFLFLVLLTQAAITDMKEFRIPNFVSVALILLYVPFALSKDTAGSLSHDIVMPLLFATGMFVLGFLLFTTGTIGAGDIKLLVAISLWTPPALLPTFILATALIGGVLACLIAAYRIATHYKTQGYLPALKGTKIPYGVAISAAGYFVGLQYLKPFAHFTHAGV